MHTKKKNKEETKSYRPVYRVAAQLKISDSSFYLHLYISYAIGILQTERQIPTKPSPNSSEKEICGISFRQECAEPNISQRYSPIPICCYAGDQIVLFVLHLLYILSSVFATVNLDCNQ